MAANAFEFIIVNSTFTQVPLPIYPHAICPNPRTGYHEREGDTGRESGIAELRSLLNNNNPSVDSPQTRADCCFLSCSPPCRSSNPLGSVHHTSWAKTAKVASLSNLEVLESLHGSSLPNSTFMLPSSLPRPTTNYLGTSPAETTGVF